MTTIRFISLAILIGVDLTSCSQEKDKERYGICSELSIKASEDLSDYLYKSKDQKKLLSALAMYDSAINCDSLNSINYQSKITVLGLLNRHEEIIGMLEKLYELSDGTDVNVIVSKAIVYEKIGMKDSSHYEFERAFDLYDRRLEQYPQDSLKIICERIYLVAITQGKDSAIQKFEPYLLKYPQDSSIKIYNLLLRNFDRKSILAKY